MLSAELPGPLARGGCSVRHQVSIPWQRGCSCLPRAASGAPRASARQSPEFKPYLCSAGAARTISRTRGCGRSPAGTAWCGAARSGPPLQCGFWSALFFRGKHVHVQFLVEGEKQQGNCRRNGGQTPWKQERWCALNSPSQAHCWANWNWLSHIPGECPDLLPPGSWGEGWEAEKTLSLFSSLPLSFSPSLPLPLHFLINSSTQRNLPRCSSCSTHPGQLSTNHHFLSKNLQPALVTSCFSIPEHS